MRLKAEPNLLFVWCFIFPSHFANLIRLCVCFSLWCMMVWRSFLRSTFHLLGPCIVSDGCISAIWGAALTCVARDVYGGGVRAFRFDRILVDCAQCAQGRAAWLERGRRCSVQENSASCHRRWVKRNRVKLYALLHFF